MKHSLFTKALSVFLASLMLFGTLLAGPVSAAQEEVESGETTTKDEQGNKSYPGYFDNYVSSDEVAKFLGLLSYEDYSRKYKDIPVASDTITIPAVDYDKDKSTAEGLKVYETGGGKDEGKAYLEMPESGDTTWTFTVPKTGMYAMSIEYMTPEGSFTTVERMMMLDGALPFSEARYFYLPRSWAYEYGSYDEDGNPLFETDIVDNDVRPRREEDPIWVDYFMRDWLGYTMDPFEFYLTEGEHTLTLSAAREPLAITNIVFYPYEEEASFAEWLTAKKAEGAKVITGVDNIILEAENPTNVSNACLFPANDRTSSLTTPQDPTVIKYNMLDSSVVNHWMTYKVTVPEAGLYSIAARYRQNSLIGMFTSRRIYINDEIQYREASNLRFIYDPQWKCNYVTDGSDQDLLFYLEEGENEIKVEVVLGQMTEYVYRIENIIEYLNEAYQKLLKITGPTPDIYRDYNFTKVAADAVDALGKGAEELFEIADEITEITGQLGDQVQTLQTIALTLERMYDDEYEIAPQFITFKNYIIALSNWLYAALSQPLKVDKWIVCCQGAELPQGASNFFQQTWFEITAFFGSFFMDYTTVGRKGDVVEDPTTAIELWIASINGREDALIQRHLIDNYFTPDTGIAVTLKVITAGLTEAILAGIGPDLATMSSNDTITWGMRNAVEDLSKKDENGNYVYSGFEEVCTWFDAAQMAQVTMEGKTYGIPTTIGFMMMFYRSDVLAEMGLTKIPETWDELEDILPALMNQHLEIGIPSIPTLPTDPNGVSLFIYQHGETMYQEDDPEHMGWACNLDNKVALGAFAQMTDYFTKYKCDVIIDVTRFRTGEVPIIIGDAINFYNTLMGFYELRGLWEMVPLPGVLNEETGEINRTSTVATTALVIPRGANNPNSSWEYIKWNMSERTQLQFYKETLCVNPNPTVKSATANLNALRGEAWTDDERIAIEAQLEQLAGVPEYPGNYIINQYVSHAFYDVYNNGTDPITAMQDRVLDINKEISRKRKEFGLPYFKISYTVSDDGADK